MKTNGLQGSNAHRGYPLEDLRLDNIAFRLRELTKRCRPDMHEPDEQSITARFVGTSFDNAGFMGVKGVPDEMSVILTDTVTKHSMTINLCDLIALARLA